MSVRCAGMAALTRVVTALCIIVLSCQRHVVFCGASEQDISTSSLPTEHAPLSTRQRLKLPGKDLQLPQTVSGNSEQVRPCLLLYVCNSCVICKQQHRSEAVAHNNSPQLSMLLSLSACAEMKACSSANQWFLSELYQAAIRALL